jgi:mRNA interferase RelE/StbE
VSYRVEMSQRARRSFLALPKRDRQRIGERLLQLADNPRPHGTKALSGPLKGHYRLRVGDYRVVYTVEDDERVALVVRVGPRASVYGNMERGT